MKSVVVTGPGTTAVVEVPTPQAGPADALVRMRACGICGSDGFYVARLTELHGTAGNAMGASRAGTDIYLDAAGVPW